MAEMKRGGPHGPHGGPRGGFQKPKNMGKTISTLLRYVGRSRWLLAVVAVREGWGAVTLFRRNGAGLWRSSSGGGAE